MLIILQLIRGRKRGGKKTSSDQGWLSKKAEGFSKEEGR